MDWAAEVAFVTGATRGIGRAVVETFAARGAKVAFCGRGETDVRALEAALRSQSREVVGLVCDVRDEQNVNAFAVDAAFRLGNPTILVNKAGIGRFGRVADMSAADWDDVMATNVRGTFLMTRACLPAMLQAGRGSIVNVVSLSGKTGVVEGAAYAASKHAVLGFSRSLMLEVRKQGVRVIAVCPGSVDTAFFDGDTPFNPNRATILKPADVADAILAALELPARALVSELDIRPANP